MGRRFSKRQTKRTKTKLRPDEVNNVIEKLFIDNMGNKIKMQYDFRPHSINDPTFSIKRDYGD